MQGHTQIEQALNSLQSFVDLQEHAHGSKGFHLTHADKISKPQ
jgi:hypothetical protein